jgi:hypothetical protein
VDLLRCSYFKGIWFTAYEAGLWLEDSSGDCFVDESVGEYNFGGFIHFADSTCDCWIRNSNVWASQSDRYSYGIYSAGSSFKVTGSKFVGFAGAGVLAGGASVQVTGNTFFGNNVGVDSAGGGSIISDNAFYGRMTEGAVSGSVGPLPGTALISLHPATSSSGSYVITGNLIEDTDAPGGLPTLVIGHNASGVISGNAIRKLNTTTGRTYHLIEVDAGGGAGMLITGNTFRAGALGDEKDAAISPQFAGMASNNLGAVEMPSWRLEPSSI